MEYLFRKSIGPYVRGKRYKINKTLADVYLRAGVVEGNYSTKEITSTQTIKKEYTVEQLRSMVKERGIKVHHKAGEAKLREALGL